MNLFYDMVFYSQAQQLNTVEVETVQSVQVQINILIYAQLVSRFG